MENELVLFTVATLPVFLIGLFVYMKDRERESKSILVKLFFLGIASCIPVAIIEVIIEMFFGDTANLNLVQLFLYVLIGVAMVEEFAKWIITYKVGWKSKEFNYLYDMIVYGVFAALGFAFFENLFYVYDNGIGTGIARAIMAVPGHACDGLLMGYFLGLAKINYINGNMSLYRKNKLLSYFVPVILHTTYDFFLFTEKGWGILLCIIQVIITYCVCLKKIKIVSNATSKIDVKICRNCGIKNSGNFCTNCGNKF